LRSPDVDSAEDQGLAICRISKRELKERVGERAKDVFTGIVRKFNVETFKDSDGEVVFLVVDRKKIKVKARRVS